MVLHRGSGGDRGRYAQSYVRQRSAGVEKDVRICLTGTPLKGTSQKTHAYFPALATCCAFLEHLSCLFAGKSAKKLGHPGVATFASQFLRQPDYDPEVIRVIFTAFRNPVAHFGVANGVWVDRRNGILRRLTWKLDATGHFPPLEVVPEVGTLRHQPPWPCKYTHRVRIRLLRVLLDLRDGAEAFAGALPGDQKALDRFYRVMDQVYPR